MPNFNGCQEKPFLCITQHVLYLAELAAWDMNDIDRGPVRTTTKEQLRRKVTEPYPVASKGLSRSARSSGRVVHAASKTMDYPMSPQTPQTPQAEMQQLMMEVQEEIDDCGFAHL